MRRIRNKLNANANDRKIKKEARRDKSKRKDDKQNQGKSPKQKIPTKNICT